MLVDGLTAANDLGLTDAVPAKIVVHTDSRKSPMLSTFDTTALRLGTTAQNIEIVILHGLRRWFDKHGTLRGDGQRVSRHYYDLRQLALSPLGAPAIADTALGANCVAHARMFFNRPDFDLESAVPGSFALTPRDAMIDQLRVDYRAMRGMIFGDSPEFEAVLESINSLETRLNEFLRSAEQQLITSQDDTPAPFAP